MKRCSLLLLVLVFGCSRDRAPDRLVDVVVANTDIPAGTPLGLDNLAQRKVPFEFVSSNNLSAETGKEALGRISLIPLKRGDMLLASAFGAKLTDGFAEHVDEGFRGAWVPLSASVAPIEYLRTGDRIDLTAALKDEESGEPVVVGLVEDVQVIDVRQKAVAVNVTAEQAARIQLADQMGSIEVRVRRRGDHQSVDAGTTTFKSLFPSKR